MSQSIKTTTLQKPIIRVLLILGAVVLPLVVAIIALMIGRYNVSVNDVFCALGSKFSLSECDPQTATVILNMRLPRVILALLVGAGLSVSGVAFQGLFSNPLATPDLLGVASGASFGAVLGIFFGFNLLFVQSFALVGGILAVTLTYLAAHNRQHVSSIGIILAGIIIGALFNALISLIKFVANSETQLPSITYWLMGSLSSVGYSTLALSAPFIGSGLIVFFIFRWRLNILSLSDDEARATGTNVTLLRIITVLFATMITASCVSACGQVGWVGLLIPHICRMIFGNNTKYLVPASISIGATYMVIVDTIARSITATEISISILTAIIGAPFFIFLLRKSRGWNI